MMRSEKKINLMIRYFAVHKTGKLSQTRNQKKVLPVYAQNQLTLSCVICLAYLKLRWSSKVPDTCAEKSRVVCLRFNYLKVSSLKILFTFQHTTSRS